MCKGKAKQRLYGLNSLFWAFIYSIIAFFMPEPKVMLSPTQATLIFSELRAGIAKVMSDRISINKCFFILWLILSLLKLSFTSIELWK